MSILNIRVYIAAALLACAAFASPTLAQDTPPETEETATAEAESAVPAGPELQYQTGTITLPNKVATLHLGDKYRYLDPNETNKLLMAWGNESDTSTQGTIIPADVDPWSETGWAVILTYDDDGHIDDSDAAEIDYDDMLHGIPTWTDTVIIDVILGNRPKLALRWSLAGGDKAPRSVDLEDIAEGGRRAEADALDLCAGGLQPGSHLARLPHGYHVVVAAGGEQHRWVVGAIGDPQV